MKILIVVGTRPNFIKITQFKKVAALQEDVEVKIVHSGQHYDQEMSKVFFKEFDLSIDKVLTTDRDSTLKQMATTMISLENYINTVFYPDVILVPGDVNTTLSAGLVANKMGIKLGHIESGLRSFDRDMPEEINRILVDEITDYFFVTEKSGIENLMKEGKPKEKIHFVGNTMLDTLVSFKHKIDSSTIISDLKLNSKFALLTFHRPSNVDNEEGLSKIVDLLNFISEHLIAVFVLHPRTIKNLTNAGLMEVIKSNPRIKTVAPLGYFDFQKLIKEANFILTDSGGIQEEATFRRVPCLTFRENTERPITCEEGSNILVGTDFTKVKEAIRAILKGEHDKGVVPKLWDGESTERIINVLLND